MTRSEVVRRIFMGKRELLVGDVDRMVDLISAKIAGALADGRRVELRGFGVFSPKPLSAKIAASPRGGARIQLPERTGVKFKAGKVLNRIVNE